MTVYQVSDLNKRIPVSSTSTNPEITGGTSTSNDLDTSFISSASSSVSELGKDITDGSISTMKYITNSGKSAFESVNSTASDTLNQVKNFDYGKMYNSASSEATGLVNSSVDYCKGQVNNCIKSTQDFMKAVNPTNGNLQNSIKNLAKFLACPESSLLGDLTNSVNNVLGKGLNANPKNLLNTALGHLSKSILGDLPGVNSLLNFSTALTAYLGTSGANKSYAMSLINSLLNQHGKSSSYLTNVSAFRSLSDLLNVSDGTVKTLVSNSLYNNTYTALPVPTTNTKCSQLAKLIQQLLNSYRLDNIYTDLSPIAATTANITDQDIRNIVDDVLGTATKVSNYNLEQNANVLNGYTGETAINSSFAAAIENTRVLNNLLTELDNINGNSIALQAAVIKMENDLKYLKRINNITLQKLYSFDEGLETIARRNNFYDLSNSVSGTKV